MRIHELEAVFLEVTGEDRLDFVSGLVSNQVKQLPDGGTSISLVLNHRGQALAQLRTLRFPERLLLVSEDGAGPGLLEDFSARIIFDQVELEDVSSRYRLFSLQGPGAADLAASTFGASDTSSQGVFSETADGLLLAFSKRSLAGGVDLIASAIQADELLERFVSLGAQPSTPADLDRERVLAGVATAAGEGGEGVLPQEAGLEPFVSYRKGCYLGQEIMARIEARGRLRRDLAGLTLVTQPAAGERDITHEGRNVGRLGTVALDAELGVIALAVLRNDLPADAEFMVGGVSAKRRPLPASPETASPSEGL